MKFTAKRDDFCALTSYFSDNNDLMAEQSGFELAVQVHEWRHRHKFLTAAGQVISGS